MKYGVAILFFLVSCTVFANTRHQQLIKDIDRYMRGVDSLIEHCRDCFDRTLDHNRIISTTEGCGGMERWHRLKHNGMSTFEIMNHVMDSLMKSTGKSFNEIMRNEKLFSWYLDKVEKMTPILLSVHYFFCDSYIDGGAILRRSYTTSKYFQSNKLVAIRKEFVKYQWQRDRIGQNVLDEGKLILYINDSVVFHHERVGNINVRVRAIARRNNLRMR